MSSFNSKQFSKVRMQVVAVSRGDENLQRLIEGCIGSQLVELSTGTDLTKRTICDALGLTDGKALKRRIAMWQTASNQRRAEILALGFSIKDFKITGAPNHVIYYDEFSHELRFAVTQAKGQASDTAPAPAPAPEATPVPEEAPRAESAPDAEPSDELIPFQFIMLPKTLVVVRDGTPINISVEHARFNDIRDKLNGVATQYAGTGGKVPASVAQDIYDAIDMKARLEKWGNGRLEIMGSRVLFDGQNLWSRPLQNKLLAKFEEGDETFLERMSKFIEKCDSNPSNRVVTRIYEFAEASDIDIDDSGDLVVWKVVRGNYMDKHSGTMSNKVGETVKVKRHQVDEREEETCSYGLHICSASYIKSFYNSGDRVLRCTLNPTNVVSIPRDYNSAKVRCCEYKVVEDVTDRVLASGWANIKG